MFELMAVIAGVLFALGYFIGRMRTETQQMETDIREIERQRNHWRDVLKGCAEQMDRINAARMQ